MTPTELFNAKLTAELKHDRQLTDYDGLPRITSADGKITVRWEVSNDGYAVVEFTLYDIGDDAEKVYDLDISVSNEDNVGPITMLAQLQKCMEQFYALGLNTKFGRIVGDL